MQRTQRETFDVAVVGTGVVGLAAALGFAQQARRVALLGPATGDTTAAPFDARIYAIAPASVLLLEKLGVWRQVDVQRTAAIERMRVFGDAGDELVFDAYTAAVPRLATIVEERELVRVLATACGFQPLIERIDGSFASLTGQASGRELVVDDGRKVSADLIIGADGGQSALRAAAGINAVEHGYQQRAVVANFACQQPHRNIASQWFGADDVVALLPLPGDHVSLVWSAPEKLAASLVSLEPADLAERVSSRTKNALGRLMVIGPVASFPLRRLTVANPVQPGLVLVGDAAHVVHPLAGQGLNLGLQDVAVLLDVLAAREPQRSVGDLLLLRRYRRRRAEAVSLMSWTTDGLQRLFALDDPLARAARNTGLAVVDRLVPLKNALIRRALG